jgi:hypothetical protein
VSNFILSSLPEKFDCSLPEFTINGVLPPGDFAPTKLEFEERFVQTGDRKKRNTVYDGWERHRSALLEAGLSSESRQLLNGSFTTNKESPGDIDLAVEVCINDMSELALKYQKITNLLQGSEMKATYYCDAYPIPVLPENHPNYEKVTVRAIRYWTKWFGQTRDEMDKGRVWTTTGGFYEK